MSLPPNGEESWRDKKKRRDRGGSSTPRGSSTNNRGDNKWRGKTGNNSGPSRGSDRGRASSYRGQSNRGYRGNNNPNWRDNHPNLTGHSEDLQAAKSLIIKGRDKQPNELARWLDSGLNAQWEHAWMCSNALPFDLLLNLAIMLAKLPNSAKVTPPRILHCCQGLKILISNPNLIDAVEISERANLLLNAIDRLFGFIWEEDKDLIKNELKEVAQAIMMKLAKIMHLKDGQDLVGKVLQLNTKIENRIRIREIVIQDESESQLTEITWRNPTVSWLQSTERFSPACLPKCNVPKHNGGRYESEAEYLDTFSKLWTGITFHDGCHAINPSCNFHQNGKACGDMLSPIKHAPEDRKSVV